MTVDWRAILKRYMRSVLDSESITYVDGLVYGSDPSLSDEERAALREAESEVIAECGEWEGVTGSSHPEIDALVTDWNTSKQARAVAALQGNAALLAQVKDEIARLESAGGARNLLEQDEVSRQVHRVLKALLAAAA